MRCQDITYLYDLQMIFQIYLSLLEERINEQVNCEVVYILTWATFAEYHLGAYLA